MYSHILISTDGSELATKGLDHGLALAAALKAKVTILTATESFPLHTAMLGAGAVAAVETLESYDEAQAEEAAKILAAAKAMADQRQVAATTLHIGNAQPADAILKAAEDLGCSLICMSSRGRSGLTRLILGSQTSEVVAKSKVPVLVVR